MIYLFNMIDARKVYYVVIITLIHLYIVTKCEFMIYFTFTKTMGYELIWCRMVVLKQTWGQFNSGIGIDYLKNELELELRNFELELGLRIYLGLRSFLQNI